MAVNYTVEALVVDIQTDKPQSTDRFLVDSNVWYWLAYSRAIQSDSPPKAYQITNYPAYIGKARSAKAKLLHSSLSLA